MSVGLPMKSCQSPSPGPVPSMRPLSGLPYSRSLELNLTISPHPVGPGSHGISIGPCARPESSIARMLKFGLLRQVRQRRRRKLCRAPSRAERK